MTRSAIDERGFSYQIGRPKPGTGQNVTIGVASAQSAAFGAGTTVIRLSATGDCRYRVSPAGGTAVATDTFLKAGVIDYALVNPTDRVQVIQEGAATGTLSITELE